MNTTYDDQAQAANIDAQSFQREQAFQHLKNVFEGKVEADVIQHVLSETHWKGKKQSQSQQYTIRTIIPYLLGSLYLLLRFYTPFPLILFSLVKTVTFIINCNNR